MVRRIILGFGGALLLAGLGLLGDTVYLELKAALAEVLIDRAFAAHLETGRPQRPGGALLPLTGKATHMLRPTRQVRPVRPVRNER